MIRKIGYGLAFLFVSATASGASISLTQVSCSSYTAVATMTVTATTKGDLIVVINSNNLDPIGNTFVSTTTDNGLNVYKAFPGYGNYSPNSGHADSQQVDWVIDAVGGVTKIFPPSNSEGSTCIWEWHSTNGWPATPYDKASTNTGSASTSWTSNNTATLSQASEAAMGDLYAIGTNTITENSPWVKTFQSPQLSNTAFFDYGEQILSANTAIAFSGTQTTTNDTGPGVWTFKDNAGGAAAAGFNKCLKIDKLEQ